MASATESYGLVTRALNAPIGVTQQNRFGLTRSYLPLSQYFLSRDISPRDGSDEKPNDSGMKRKALHGLEEPRKPKAGKKPPMGKKGKEDGKERQERAFWAVPALPDEIEFLSEQRRRRGQMKVAQPQKCRWCDEAATKAIIHSNAYAYVPVCDGHLGKGKKAVGAEFCYTQDIMQKGQTCELCDRPASFLVYQGAFTADRKPKGAIIKGACKGHLEQVRKQVSRDPSASKWVDPIVKRLNTEELDLDEGKKCRFCSKTATSIEGGIPCCPAHRKLGARAARKRKSTSEGIGRMLGLECKPFALDEERGVYLRGSAINREWSSYLKDIGADVQGFDQGGSGIYDKIIAVGQGSLRYGTPRHIGTFGVRSRGAGGTIDIIHPKHAKGGIYTIRQAVAELKRAIGSGAPRRGRGRRDQRHWYEGAFTEPSRGLMPARYEDAFTEETILEAHGGKESVVVGGWRILGIDDSYDSCDQCGKTGLKRTVVLEPTLDGGGIKRVGTTCAGYMTKTRGTYVMKRGVEVQREKDKGLEREARSGIIKALMASRFWKQTKMQSANYVRRGGDFDDREKRTSQRFLANLLKDTGLEAPLIREYMRSQYAPKVQPTFDRWWLMALGKSEESASRCGAVAVSSGRTKPIEVQKRKKRYEKRKAELEASGKVEVPENPGVFIDADDGIWDLIRLTDEDAGLTVFKSGAAGPSAGMTGSGNIPAVAVPIGAGNGGWDGIDWPGKRRKRKKRKGGSKLSDGIGHLLRRVW